MATSLAARAYALSCIAYIAFGSSTHAQGMQPPSAYQRAASHAGVPASVLFAVALQESGARIRGRLIPWPWTLNVKGEPSRYLRRADACAALRRALKEHRSVDVGLGQINVHYHGHRVSDPCELLDPYRNLAIVATILREHHTPGDDWLIAIGHYHRPAGGELAARYRRSVQQHLANVRGSAAASAVALDAHR
jgi:soluble lytic murein transglycosylase-like protein